MLVPIGFDRIMVDTENINAAWIAEMCKHGLMTDDVIDDLDKLAVGRFALEAHENNVWKYKKVKRKERGQLEEVTILTELPNGEQAEVTGTLGHDYLPGVGDSEFRKMAQKDDSEDAKVELHVNKIRNEHNTKKAAEKEIDQAKKIAIALN